MSEKRRRHFLKDKETKILLNEISGKLGVDLSQIFRKANVEIVETESAEFFLLDGRPLFFKSDGNVYPTLVFKEFFVLAPKVVVDMGAVPYVCKGANVMAPGIRRFEGEFRKGTIVFVVDEKHGKPIALGEMIFDSEMAKDVKQGAVVRNIHFVGDRIWDLAKKFGA